VKFGKLIFRKITRGFGWFRFPRKGATSTTGDMLTRQMRRGCEVPRKHAWCESCGIHPETRQPIAVARDAIMTWPRAPAIGRRQAGFARMGPWNRPQDSRSIEGARSPIDRGRIVHRDSLRTKLAAAAGLIRFALLRYW